MSQKRKKNNVEEFQLANPASLGSLASNQFKLHSKMSLVTLECKLAGFLASSRFLVNLASNSEFILNKIKQTQSGANTKDF